MCIRDSSKTMRRTAIMLLIKAVRDVGGDKQLKTRVEFTIGNGYYCTIKGDIKVDDEFAAKVSDRIKFLISEKMPITKRVYPLDDAIEIFKKQGMDDKVALLKYRRSSEINI